MLYKNFEIVQVGDIVRVDGQIGKVVCSIDDKEDSLEYPLYKFAYLERGVIIEFLNEEVLFIEDYNPSLELVFKNKKQNETQEKTQDEYNNTSNNDTAILNKDLIEQSKLDPEMAMYAAIEAYREELLSIEEYELDDSASDDFEE